VARSNATTARLPQEALERHDASDAPEWVRRVAPFDDVREKSRARLPAFDPVIDWTNEESERSWPLFGSEGEVRVEGLDRRTARVEKEGTAKAATTEVVVDAIGDSQSLDFTAMTPEQRRAARVRRRAERRAEAEARRRTRRKCKNNRRSNRQPPRL
jgi:hypothetical protein